MRKLLILALSCSLLVTSSPAFSATPKVGSACTKLNQFNELKSTLLVCAITKGKKTWRKATSVEKSLYLKEKNRLAGAEAKRIIDQANAEAARIVLEAKAAADKAAADAAAKAAADAAAKAAADAAAKAAADAAAKAADIFGINVLGTWSGPDLTMSQSYGWQWVAVKISNKAKSGILRSGIFTSSYVDSQGVSVDSNTEFTPTLLPNATGWLASTVHNSKSVSSTFLSPILTPRISDIKSSELPAISAISFASSGSGGIVSATITNNSSSKFLYRSTRTNVVFLNGAGVPIYAYWGNLTNSIAPGFTARVDLNAFLGGKLSFIPIGFTSIEVSLDVTLCDSDSSSSSCTN